jgi:uncharacterized membrane protein YtjA (UPF0391 family)
MMVYWAAPFLVGALVAGSLGFGSAAGLAAGIAQLLFFLFLVMLIVALVAGTLRRA